MKEREEIVQTRNKVNLGALKIQNGFHCLQFLMYFFNFTQNALKKSCYCKAVRLAQAKTQHLRLPECACSFSQSRGLKTRGAPGSSRVALGTRMGYRQPFIPEKGLATKSTPFCPTYIRKPETESLISFQLLAPLMLTLIFLTFAVNANF